MEHTDQIRARAHHAIHARHTVRAGVAIPSTTLARARHAIHAGHRVEQRWGLTNIAIRLSLGRLPEGEEELCKSSQLPRNYLGSISSVDVRKAYAVSARRTCRCRLSLVHVWFFGQIRDFVRLWPVGVPERARDRVDAAALNALHSHSNYQPAKTSVRVW